MSVAATWGRIIGLTSGGDLGFPEEVSYGAALHCARVILKLIEVQPGSGRLPAWWERQRPAGCGARWGPSPGIGHVIAVPARICAIPGHA